MASNSNVDEAELIDCIRSLVLEATCSDHDVGKDTSSGRYPDELSTQVEEILTKFLEEQARNDIVDQSESEAHGDKADPKIVLPIHQAHAYPCTDTHKTLPSPPEDWPQRCDDLLTS